MAKKSVLIDWTNSKTLIIGAAAILAVILIAPRLGDGTKSLTRWLSTTDIAYAAKEKADTVDEQFQEYLTEQRAYTKALNQVVTQQAANQAAPVPWEFIKDDGAWQVFRNPDNVLMCCNGTICVDKPAKGHCPS